MATKGNSRNIRLGFIEFNYLIFVPAKVYSAITNAESVTYSYDTLHRLSSITTESTVYSFEYDGFDNRTSIYIGDNEIVSYEYNDNNGKLKRVIYANGLTVEYEYNDIDLLNEIWYTENGIKTLRYSYAYNADGSLYGITDEARGEVITYRYDGEGKLLGTAQHSDRNMEIDYSTAYTYYGQNGLVHTSDAYLNFRVGTTPYNVSSGLVYYYNSDQSLNYTALNFPSATGTITYTYDEFDRISTISADYKKSGTVTVQRDEYYTYRTYGDDNTDGLVSQYKSVMNGVQFIYDFTYDERGFIETETRMGTTKIYTYDEVGQLIRFDNGLAYFTYSYDDAGNITLVQHVSNSVTRTKKTYGYTDSEWGDLLTSFNGNAITYDALGNPLTYYDGTSFTWQGRRLVGAVKGTKTMSFTYDDNGLRTSKTVNGITTEYYWNGNLLVAEKTPTYLVIYNYDASGRPIGMAYHGSDYTQYQWDVYWFDLNLYGDVIAVYNNDKKKLVNYTYDPWGYCDVGYYNKGATTSAVYNSLRYRGYYYDTDLGLYYLQSRYYDANTYRFVNADGYISTGQGILGYNMFAYCGNNPVNRVDNGGDSWIVVAIILAVCTISVATISGIESAKAGNSTKEIIRDVFIGAAFGFAIGGSIVATGGVGAGAIGGLSANIFGVSALQAFAAGSLALNTVAFTVAPLLGIEMQSIDYAAPSGTPTTHNVPAEVVLPKK